MTARAPGRAHQQQKVADLNGFTIAGALLSSQWTDVKFVMPQWALRPGENRLCLSSRRE